MARQNVLEFVLPGDILLIDGSSFLSLLIHIKTWDKDASHVEVVNDIAPGRAVIETFTARGPQDKGVDGKGGVNVYRDLEQWYRNVTLICRPKFPLDVDQANHWMRTVAIGQGYDYLGLLVFTLAVRQGHPHRQFCSEATTNWLRAGDGVPFHPSVPADKIAPTTYRYTPAFCQWAVSDGMLSVDACV